jgi:hypothetical protein
MMRKLLLPFLLLTGFYGNAQADNSLYKLSIQKGKFVKTDSLRYIEVPVTLTNNATDTLYYMSMSCSWQDFYNVKSNPQILKVEEVPCDKNVPYRLVLAPGKSQTVQLKLFIAEGSNAKSVTYTIEHNLVILPGDYSSFKGWKEYRKVKNIIWSNEITTRLK